MSVPFEAILGGELKSVGLSFVTRKLTVCQPSPAGPGEMLPTALATVCVPASSSTVRLVRFSTKVGGWLSGVIFDYAGSYRAAFVNGLVWNMLNVTIVSGLIWRAGRVRGKLLVQPV